jgi:N-acetylmuramoyl-L-alanine amidase
MDDKLPIQSRGMKQAPFWVLKDARMPAVLVETGFLSNPEEAQRLADETYQRKVARAVAQGISQFRKNQSGS